MDGSSIFAFSLIGGLVGFILGDFQREVRFRRQVRANLALSLVESPRGDVRSGNNHVSYVRSGYDNVPVSVSVSDSNGDSDSDSDGGSYQLDRVRNGQSRRASISRPDFRDSPASGVRGRSLRGTTPASVSSGYDCG